MAIIKLHTNINAPIERCFLLSLSVDLHTSSVSSTNEKAIAGVTKGILKLGDQVTWQAKHFGITQQMTMVISAYNKPFSFEDKMLAGPFKNITHTHLFEEDGNKAIMTDVFEFEAPLGLLGRFAEKLFLTSYMKKFLLMRNNFLKEVAEGDEWMRFV